MPAAPYGTWLSPITAELIARGSVSVNYPDLSGGHVWWIERRPQEDGRSVVRKRPVEGGEAVDVIPQGFDARTRVHEYGGGAYLVDGETLFFSNDADGRLYRVDPGGEPRAITPEPSEPRALRYADGDAHPGGAFQIWVRERHEGEGEPVNELVALDQGGGSEPRLIASGHDFYSSPRISPDGTKLAWTTWDHPRMPWDGSELWVADLAADGTLGSERLVAGGPKESIFQPEWSPAGELHYVSDRSGWWNLYRDGRDESLCAREAEFGGPQWIFGLSAYTFLDDGRIVCLVVERGFGRLAHLTPDGELAFLDLDYEPTLYGPRVRSDGQHLTYAGAAPDKALAIVLLHPERHELEVVARSIAEQPDGRYISTPRAIEFPTGDGSATAHALFYRPRSAGYEPPEGELPPLLVMSHGGPTGAAAADLDLDIQFWTSRGIAVVDVNYRGSTGYGRAYRELLEGNWGIADVEDCIAAARHLAAEGEADPSRLAITGGSAGGYTTLGAVAWHDFFHAGTSYYGVADIEALFGTTHKFESRYDESLIGTDRDVWRERSPLYSADQISCPLLILQGLEDAVVTPDQAEMMVAALEKNGTPYAYLAFEGEQHGFRKAENIQRSLEAELDFYGQVLGFDPADEIEPVEIKNL
jgi:dipeptidyl aminopeptidase/acylaminoacyl peptidase